MEALCGLSANAWIAIWTALLTVATFLLVGVARYQLRAIRAEAKRGRTIAACERYDLDPVLDRASREVAAALRSGELAIDPKAFVSSVDTLLNFLDQLAIGCEMDVYDSDILKQFLEPIVKRHVSALIDSGIAREIADGQDHFPALQRMRDGWV